MNKIIQLLRLSRLVLLVILLLFAVAAKIARAELAQIFANHQSEYIYPSARAACEAIGAINPPGSDNYSGGICIDAQTRKQIGAFTAITKSCDAKELTNPNGYDGLSDRFFLAAPQGIDAADWYSDKFSSCENNCLVVNTRIPTTIRDQPGFRADGRSILEDDGISWSWFKKRQTGAVCVTQKQKPNDPPKPPPPDTGDGTDGNGQGNPGSNNGQGGETGGSGENGSQGGSDGQNNQGSGNSNDSSPDGSGSGGGSGGGSSGGLQIGPGGGGAGGSSDSGSEGEGSEGSDGDGQSGSSQEGGGSGDSGGQGGADSGGQGQVGGTEGGDSGGQPGADGDSGEAGGHYFPCPSGKGSYKKGTEPSAECLGEGKGDGSIGGGSCDTDTPPDCKGDAVQCYIAKEQWRTACAASGKSNKIEGEGNCQEKQPPQCKGDAVQCYIAKQQWQQGCAAAAAQGLYDELEQYGNSEKGYLDELQKEGNPEGLLRDIKPEKIDLSGQLKTNLVNLPGACPSFPALDLGIFGSHQIPTDNLCDMLRSFGRILLALSYVFAFGIVVRAF